MTAKDAGRLVLKWFVVPIVMAALGFYFIGPKIGDVPALKAGAEKVQQIVQPQETAPKASDSAEPDTPEKGAYDNLDVKVSNRDTKPIRRERKPKEEPKDEPKKPKDEVPVTPPADETQPTKTGEPDSGGTTGDGGLPDTGPARNGDGASGAGGQEGVDGAGQILADGH